MTDPIVQLSTPLGVIVIKLASRAAPRTVANFLAYVDQGLFSGANFYRSVRLSDPHRCPMALIQGGLGSEHSHIPPITHEPTSLTGLSHRSGTVTMARNAVGTAQAEFAICIEDAFELDWGGQRNLDRAGFAAFGQVIEGFAVAAAIHRLPRDVGDNLVPPVPIQLAARIPEGGTA